MWIPKDNIVFVHVPKAAGQSMENALLDHLGKDRSKNGPEFLLMKNDNPDLGPKRLAHLSAEEYVNLGYLTQEEFDNCFSFGFVRNPFDRAVSLYRYSGLAALISFKSFVLDYLEILIKEDHWFYRPQTDFLFGQDDAMAVQFVGRFESIQTDWANCCEAMGLPLLSLKRDNKTQDTKLLSPKSLRWFLRFPSLITRLSLKKTWDSSYMDFYDLQTRTMVAGLYERDFRLLNYSI